MNNLKILVKKVNESYHFKLDEELTHYFKGVSAEALKYLKNVFFALRDHVVYGRISYYIDGVDDRHVANVQFIDEYSKALEYGLNLDDEKEKDLFAEYLGNLLYASFKRKLPKLKNTHFEIADRALSYLNLLEFELPPEEEEAKRLPPPPFAVKKERRDWSDAKEFFGWNDLFDTQKPGRKRK